MPGKYHVGLIVPSSNLTMETELPAMAAMRRAQFPDEEFVFHASRMRMKKVTPEELAAMNAQTERASRELADAQPDIVASACLVAIMAQGPGYHCQAEQQIGEGLRSEGIEIPVVSSAGALLRALHHLSAKKIVVVAPYMKELTAKVVAYIEDAGIAVLDSVSLEVPDNIEVANLDPADLKEHWKRLEHLDDADAVVLSACVQMPSLPSIQAVEDVCGKPVLSAATATMWCVLNDLGLEPRVPGAGSLLAGGPGSR